MRKLILDFDGVLADSWVECFHLISKKNKLTKLQIDSISENFKKFRYLVAKPYGFQILLEILLSNDLTNVPAKFFNEQANWDEDSIDVFHRDFFQSRENIIKKNGRKAWVDMNPVTDFFKELKRKGYNFKKYILSTKDESSISIWLSENNFEVDKVYGSNSLKGYENKFDFIKKTFCHNSKKIFIDDNDKFIEGFDWVGINCDACHAGWGYSSKNGDTVENIIKKLNYHDLHN